MTLRDEGCASCPIYCQEGLFTARVSTDGSISPCLDRYAELPYINGRAASTNELDIQTSALFQRLEAAQPMHAFSEFQSRSNVALNIP